MQATASPPPPCRVCRSSTTHTTQSVGDVLEPAFALVIGGAKHTALNGEVYRYGPGEYLVATVDLPVVGSIVAADDDEPFMAVAFRLNPDRIASLLLDTGSPRGVSDAHSPSAFGVWYASPPLLDAVARLLALLDAPADVAALAAGIEREILWRLLAGPQGSTIRQIGIADSRLAHLARSIGWIRCHYQQPLRVEDMAATAAMSPSSFHRHFLTLTSMTPPQYQKQLRLNEARIRLLTGDHEVAQSVSTSATPAPPSSVASTAACSASPPAKPPRTSIRRPSRPTQLSMDRSRRTHRRIRRGGASTRSSGSRAPCRHSRTQGHQ